jgi:hypothetical protein
MERFELAKELAFRKDWVMDPPPELYKQFEFKDLARLAVIQLQAKHAMLKATEEALEEAMKVYSQYAR